MSTKNYYSLKGYKDKYLIGFFKAPNLKIARTILGIILLLQQLLLLHFYITKPIMISISIGIYLTSYIVFTFLMFLFFEFPKKVTRGGIEGILDKYSNIVHIDVEINDYSNVKKVSNLNELIKYHELPDDCVVDLIVYKLKHRNTRLFVTIPVAATLVYKSIQLLPQVFYNLILATNLDKVTLFQFIIDFIQSFSNDMMINQGMSEVLFLGYMLIIYFSEAEEIQILIHKIELAQQIRNRVKNTLSNVT